MRRDRRHAPVWRSRFDGSLASLPFDDAPEGPLPATRGSDIAGFWNGTGPAGDAFFAMFGTFVRDGRPETGSPDVAPVRLGASDDHAHLAGRAPRRARPARSAAKAVAGARVVVGHVVVDRRGVMWRSSAKPPGRPGRLGATRHRSSRAAFRHRCLVPGARGHHVRVVPDDAQCVCSHGLGGHVQYCRCELAGESEHARRHQQQTLRAPDVRQLPWGRPGPSGRECRRCSAGARPMRGPSCRRHPRTTDRRIGL